MDQEGLKQTFEILEQIEKVSGRNDKMELLSKLINNEFAKFYFETVFNPFLTYGVTPSLGVKDQVEEVSDLAELKEFRTRLAGRLITGDAARVLIESTYRTSDVLVNKWIYRMWKRDIRCGISTTSINKVFKNLIPEFGVQLASAITEEKLDHRWTISRKLNGFRAFFIFKNFKCETVLSRNGKELHNCGHIVHELEFRKVIKEGVLDGELMATGWNDTASIARSSVTKKDGKAMKLYPLDYIPLDEWEARKGIWKRQDREQILLALPDNLEFVVKVNEYPVRDTEYAWELARKFLDEGYEGAVAKNLDAVYEFGRSTSWLKLKFTETVDLPIIEVIKGTGKNADRLGAFICDFNGVKVSVGGGYTDDERVHYWLRRTEMIGVVIEVKYQEITKDKSLLFPVFQKLRPDKS